MKCQQCEKPAVLDFGEGEGKHLPLCVDCSHKLQSVLESQQSIRNHQFLENAAMRNHCLDEMDFIIPIRTSMRRIPVQELARAMSKGTVYHNIHVTNSNVGMINTGDLAKIDALITVTKGSDAEEAGQQIKALAQAIIDAKDIDDAGKKELVELVQGLSQELVGGRKREVDAHIYRGACQGGRRHRDAC
jgi:hypothetical protein